ncbi:uncharacterized protein LOC142743575 isoform X2 [Rhinoderma darwinii]|uniref:uncharacterized protein LOC142743575 isoform X2 n=1 Tax=Rhinoderma darwinii TaxID=43563 RepID=UPI003F67F2EF
MLVYEKLITEAIQQYGDQNNIKAHHINGITQHVIKHCKEKMTELWLQEHNHEQQNSTQQTPVMEEMSSGPEDLQEEHKHDLQNTTQQTPVIKELSSGPAEHNHEQLNSTQQTPVMEEMSSGPEEEHKHDLQNTTQQTPVIKELSSGPAEMLTVEIFNKFVAEVHNQQKQFQHDIFDQLREYKESKEMSSLEHFNKAIAEMKDQQHQYQNFLLQQLHEHKEPKVIIDLDPKSMTEHHKPDQEFQGQKFTQLNQQQQIKVSEKSNQMENFTKNTEMQTTLFCQPRNYSETEMPDDHLSVNKSVVNRGKQLSQIFGCHELGVEFCKFFYSRLNSQNPSHGQERLDWGPNHFWDDAILSIYHGNSFEKYTGGECVSSKLLEMTQEQKLTFIPALDSERFKCVNSKHGLVVVAVTGVISSNNNNSGVFNQIFGLIKCPCTNNYKIKSMNLHFIEYKFQVPPLQYTTEQLQEFKE